LDRLQRSNVGHYWIPSTLKIIPEMKNHLIENLTEMMASCLKPRDQLLHAWITVTKVVRLKLKLKIFVCDIVMGKKCYKTQKLE
jgi:beta-lactamase class D